MSAIDDVIQRSRQPGGFVEHKRFTVARSRAIEKMRKFALADPRFYVLELIQAAVANGADYVDLELRKSEVILSYVGGGFSEEELGQLFDFLFASKEQLEFADIRQLALGINALLLGRPDEVVIESGDGTAARTTRVRIDGRSEAIEVGRPHQPLRGTYVRASGVNRAALGGLVDLGEQSAIEQRCLTAPVPIFVNSEPLFGYGASRTPRLLGYQSWLAFDEGDLYGAIGISRWEEDQVFKLLTFGVWIDTVRADILPGTPLGGIVCFDRLHKTADHAAIVQDERLQELWHRLRPYARQLREGRVGSKARDVWLLDGTRLETTRLREILRRFPTVLAIDPPLPAPSTGSARRAVAISTALNAPVLCLPSEDIATLKSLGGEKLRVLYPDVRDDTEVAFYQQPTTEPPARPWVIAPVEVAPLPVPALVERLEQAGFLRNTIPEPPAAEGQRLVAALGAAAELKATVYVPEQTQHSTELRIDLVVTNRRVWTETVPSAWPGCVLRVELPDVSPRVVLRPSPSQPGTSTMAK